MFYCSCHRSSGGPNKAITGDFLLKITRAKHVALAAAFASIVGAGAAASADAYTHSWACSRGDGNRCTDYTGTKYNPWHHIQSNTSNIMYTYCVSGESVGGGIYNFDCRNNSINSFGSRCTAPDVVAYSYKYAGGTTDYLENIANTTGGC